MKRKLITLASAVLIAGVVGVLTPPLSAASLSTTRRAAQAAANRRDDPVIGYVTKWFYEDADCYGGDGDGSPWWTPGTYPDPDMIAIYVVHGTLYEDGTYTDTGEDFGGTYGFQCGDYSSDGFTPAAEACFNSESCPLLDISVEQP